MDTNDKLPNCCARRTVIARLTRADLARLARIAAGRPNGPSPKLRDQIAEAREALQDAESWLLQHLEDDTLEHE